MNFGTSAEEYYRRANDEILVIIQTEHIKAVDIADEIYAVPGVDAVFVGPNDLTYSMRSDDGKFPSKELFEATLTRIREAAQRQKLPCGLHVFSATDALKRAEEGTSSRRERGLRVFIRREIRLQIGEGSEIVGIADGDADDIFGKALDQFEHRCFPRTPRAT